jgi:hypothetical protein
MERMLNTDGMPFRDGLPYQHQLQAVRNVIDAHGAEAWTSNIYMSWLWALRALSEPTVGAEYPESMRTRAWAMRTLNTQLASWTELRHDTILYAKQPYSNGGGGCGYPDGFVEPRPEFWRRMGRMSEVAAAAVSTLNVTGRLDWIDFAAVRTAQLSFFTNFSAVMDTLRGMSEKELAQIPFTPSETEFLKTIADQNASAYGAWDPGWYTRLTYGGYSQAVDPFDSPLVADVFTDVPSTYFGDPGGVLHEATGRVNLLMIAIDNGPDRAVYAGPVYSHYEFYEPGVNRLSDKEWQQRLEQARQPAPPEWTEGWLITTP